MKKIFAVAIGAVVLWLWLVLVMVGPLYLLWNWLMPDLFGVREINFFWESFGVTGLAILLFKSNGSSSSSG